MLKFHTLIINRAPTTSYSTLIASPILVLQFHIPLYASHSIYKPLSVSPQGVRHQRLTLMVQP